MATDATAETTVTSQAVACPPPPWRELADTALGFIQRFTQTAPAVAS